MALGDFESGANAVRVHVALALAPCVHFGDPVVRSGLADAAALWWSLGGVAAGRETVVLDIEVVAAAVLSVGGDPSSCAAFFAFEVQQAAGRLAFDVAAEAEFLVSVDRGEIEVRADLGWKVIAGGGSLHCRSQTGVGFLGFEVAALQGDVVELVSFGGVELFEPPLPVDSPSRVCVRRGGVRAARGGAWGEVGSPGGIGRRFSVRLSIRARPGRCRGVGR